MSSAAHTGDTVGGGMLGCRTATMGFAFLGFTVSSRHRGVQEPVCSQVPTLLPGEPLATLPGLAVSPSLHPEFLKMHCHMLYELWAVGDESRLPLLQSSPARISLLMIHSYLGRGWGGWGCDQAGKVTPKSWVGLGASGTERLQNRGTSSARGFPDLPDGPLGRWKCSTLTRTLMHRR